MKNAIEKVAAGEMGLNKASNQFLVPKTTLKRKLEKYKATQNIDTATHKKLGRFEQVFTKTGLKLKTIIVRLRKITLNACTVLICTQNQAWVTYQLKLLTTAFFAVLVLKRRLKKWQWCALALLAAGVALVQLSSTEKKDSAKSIEGQSRILGFGAALAACFISGFAGIYFEKVLKESDISVWMRNVQLSLLSLPFGLVTYLINNGGSMKTMLTGFDGFVWYLVILQAAGGLIVAVVVKYADNILKGFATSVAIIISCVASIYIFEFILTIQFAVGTMLVIGSIFLYGYVPKKKETRSSLSV
ncbi:hypothetical protein ACJJTC_019673 [Scirpophaga incertulas]